MADLTSNPRAAASPDPVDDGPQGVAPRPPIERNTAFDDRRIELPEGGWPVESPPFRAEDFRGLPHRAQYLAMRAAQRAVLALPAPLREAIVTGVAGLGRRFDRRHTRAAEAYIRAALPDASDAEVTRLVVLSWRHLLRVALVSEGVNRRVMGARLGDHYEVWSTPAAAEVLASHQAAFFITAHAGFWEASCPGLVGMGTPASYAIGKAPRNDFVAQHIQRIREAQGMRLIPRYGAMSVVPAAIRAGGAVGMLLDHRPRQKPVFAPFFGKAAACDRSAGVLLRRVKAPLVFYGCYGLPGDDPLKSWRFELRLTNVIQPEELSGLDPAGVAARINAELEELILHRPEQVFWLHDRFKPSWGGPFPSDEEVAEAAAVGEARRRTRASRSFNSPPAPTTPDTTTR